MLMPVKLDGKQHMAPNNGMLLAEYWENYFLKPVTPTTPTNLNY